MILKKLSGIYQTKDLPKILLMFFILFLIKLQSVPNSLGNFMKNDCCNFNVFLFYKTVVQCNKKKVRKIYVQTYNKMNI